MIILGSMRDCERLKAECHKVYAIVRSYKKPIKGVEQLSVLSPSPALFGFYLEKKNRGEWNDVAFGIYKKRFEEELHSEEALNALRGIWKASQKQHKKIGLVCYCPDFRYCHRSLVGEFLESYGCEVIYK
jgi:uncharacterized protein YeaO (DUF488 family)